MYSHFVPIQPEGDRKVWKPIPTGGWLPATMDEFTDPEAEFVSQNIDLESYEQFSQLQSVVSMVKTGPKQGYFLSNVTIGEGLTRVWRNWLLERVECPASETLSEEEHRKKLLWSSIHEHTGLRLRVNERHEVAAPVLRARDEDENLGYTLHYEGMSSLSEKGRVMQMLMRCRTGDKNVPDASCDRAVVGAGGEA